MTFLLMELLPICGPGTISRRSHHLKKNLNDNQGQKWLPAGYHWRSILGFDGIEDHGTAPVPITGEDVVHWASVREASKADGTTPLSSDPAREYGIKKLSGLYQLPYW
jgi:hypothetical protein